MQRIRPISGAWLACYAELLLALDATDRRLRFGAPATDAAVRAHVAALTARGAMVLAMFRDGALAGAVELAPDGTAVELAIVVAPPARRRGIAWRLLRAALAVARGSEARVQILAENRAMRRLAVRGGFVLRPSGAEMLGVRPLERRIGGNSLAAA
ncbi:MAG: GNAT family N-acetyltransferase [Alphaproteobacteria bacterium]|nr:GNAT family N-acetyltransferase [Alphaproteobacteria bacterium]